MESSWGEKFSKILKKSIDNGLNKVEYFLKPKSLGKINLDITVKDKHDKNTILMQKIKNQQIYLMKI